MKLSIITAVFNNFKYIGNCIESVLSQTYNPIEYIVIDGGSTDGTLKLIEKYKPQLSYFISEPDGGIYDALNKGIKIASGDIIGILHSDDLFANCDVLKTVADTFSETYADVLYGDLLYVDKNAPLKIIRYWKSKPYNDRLLKKGWMPPHPTLFLKKEVVKSVGYFNINYKISADYDYILRVFRTPGLKLKYLPVTISHMRTGGLSNRSIKNILLKSKEDYRIIKEHKIGGIITLIMKNFSKIIQFFNRKC